MIHFLGVDPGRAKCGLALLDGNGKCISRNVVNRAELADEVIQLVMRYPISTIVLGDRTGSAEALHQLQEALAQSSQTHGVSIEMTQEHLSSVEGRRQYLLDHRQGWRRLVPIGLQTPPEPFDDYTAEVLARRYLSQHYRS